MQLPFPLSVLSGAKHDCWLQSLNNIEEVEWAVQATFELLGLNEIEPQCVIGLPQLITKTHHGCRAPVGFRGRSQLLTFGELPFWNVW